MGKVCFIYVHSGFRSSHFFFLFLQVRHPVLDLEDLPLFSLILGDVGVAGFFRGLPLPRLAGAKARDILPTGDSELSDMLLMSSIGVGGKLSAFNSMSMLSLPPDPSSVPEDRASSESMVDRESDEALDSSGMNSMDVLISRGSFSDLIGVNVRALDGRCGGEACDSRDLSWTRGKLH